MSATEAEKYGKINMVIPPDRLTKTIPDQNTWKLDPNASYVSYCDNETVNGVEFPFIPDTKGVPLVCDMTSSIMTRPLDITKFGVIYASSQKNMGAAGVTLVIVREDLIGNAMSITPGVLDFQVHLDAKLIPNTPPTFIVYLMSLTLEWNKRQGGLQKMYSNSLEKSNTIYDIIDNSNGFYVSPIDVKYRSRLNVRFQLGSENMGDENLTKAFLTGAAERNIIEIKGGPEVGGIRVSVYNSITKSEVDVMPRYMLEFMANHPK